MAEVGLPMDEQEPIDPLASERRQLLRIDRGAEDRAGERREHEPADPSGEPRESHRCASMYLAIGESSRRSSTKRIAVFATSTCGSGAWSSLPRLMSWLVAGTSGSCDALLCT